MMLSLNQDDNLRVRFILSGSDQSPQGAMEDNSKHRRLLASRVAQLANQVLELEAADETPDETPSQDSNVSTSSTSSQTFHHSYSANQIVEQSNTISNVSNSTHSPSMNECQTYSSEAHEQTASLKSPEIKSPLVPHSMMSDPRAVRREVLTNGSLRKRRQLSNNTQDCNYKLSPMLAYVIPPTPNLPGHSSAPNTHSVEIDDFTPRNR